MRDAIVYSGWSWETFNVPERMTLALAHLGSTVLYVENPVSVFNQKSPSALRPIGDHIFAFRPVFLGHKLQVLPLLPMLQAKKIARQIVNYERQLALRNPLFFYPWMGTLWSLPVEMRKRGHFLVRMLMDQPELNKENRLGMADFTLLNPMCGLHYIKGSFSGKACLVPQAVDLDAFDRVSTCPEPEDLAHVPHPRLCYLGPAVPDRLNLPVVRELLQRHPEWHFVSFGASPLPDIPNAHGMPWTSYEKLPVYIRNCEVGFMPYNCDERQLHANPLKLWEYFALGKPVVVTPLIHLWEYEDVIYRGHSTEELEKAIAGALSEPVDSPKRQRRMEIAQEHSIDKLSEVLSKVLPLE